MKKFIPPLLLLIVVFGLFLACDKVEGPYRENTDTTEVAVLDSGNAIIISNDTFLFPTDVTPNVKKVLAEDYTGHLCGNCPAAGILLNDTLQDLFDEELVVISVHAGFFAAVCPNIPCPGSAAPPGSFLTDHRTPLGTVWNTFLAYRGNPKGMIDRVGYPTLQHSKSPSSWTGLIQSESNLAADFKIRIINHFDTATGELLTAVQSKFLTNNTGNFKLQVVLTEDSVIDWQEWYSHTPEYVPDFVHHHVLRDGISVGDWGVTLENGTVTAGKIKLNGFSHTVNSAWNASHCRTVAFIYDDVTKKVLQVEEAHIIQ